MVKPAPSFSMNRDRVWGLLLLAATLLAYQPAWNGRPVLDDASHITPPELRSIHGLAQIWTHPREAVQYFPLSHTAFWMASRLWGDAPLGYHLLNILLHVLSALLLVRILRKLGIPGEAAWLAGGIFALHPVMVESVAWISELKNTLSGVFFLSAALAYITYTEAGKRRPYLLALVFFVLGLLAKTSTAPFPLAMLAVVWWKQGRLSWKRDIAPTLPFFLAGMVLGLITLYVERNHIGTRGPEFEFSLVERGCIAGRALWFYLSKIFLPVDLIFVYPRWSVSATTWWQYLFPLGALAAGGVLWTMRKRWRAPLAAFLCFSAMLLPFIGFLNICAFRFSFVADRYQYLAAIGPIVLGAGLLDMALRSVRRGRVFLKTAVSAMLLLALGMLSWRQSGMYANAETLYRTTIARDDNCCMAHNNLGLLLAGKGQAHEAMAHYRKAMELSPHYAYVHNNLGLLLAEMGRTDEALARLLKAVELDPAYAEARNNLGVLLEKMGRIYEAMAHYRKVVELNPNNAEAHNNLGLLLAKTGRTAEAMPHFRKAVGINPGYADAHYNLGLLLGNMGRTDEAISHFLKTAELNPAYAEAHNNLGILLAQIGRTDEAMAHYRKAVELNPDNAEAHNNLGILLAQIGCTDEAMAHYRRALIINPEAIGTLQNLAFALAQTGHWADAASILRRALASARSAGDEVLTKGIVQILAKLQEAIDSSPADSSTRAQR